MRIRTQKEPRQRGRTLVNCLALALAFVAGVAVERLGDVPLTKNGPNTTCPGVTFIEEQAPCPHS